MTTGWSDGTHLAGIETAGAESGAYRINAYGLPVGSTVPDNPHFPSDLTVGLTTDASKSGIVADISGGVAVIIKY